MSAARAVQAPAPPIALVAVLATVAMLFAAFTAAFLMRKVGADWVAVELPPIVWVNTIVIVASSVAVERARTFVARGDTGLGGLLLVGGTSLGLLFLVGQLFAWSALVGQGVLLPTSPHASFFYLLSGVHGAHVLGGLGALAWCLRGIGADRDDRRDAKAVNQVAVYWHFVGGVWLYLLALLSLA